MSLFLMLKSLKRRKVVTGLLLLQLAMTLALLLNAVMLASQTHASLNEPTGLDMENILQVQLKPTTPELRKYPALSDLLERQLAGVRAVPGVIAVAYSNQGPLLQGGNNGNVFKVGAQERTNLASIPMYFVSADFFQVLGLTVQNGELPVSPTPLDGKVQSPVVLTQQLAEHLFAEENPVGQAVNRGPVAAVVSNFYGQRSAEHVFNNSVQVAPLYGVDWGYSLLLRVEAGSADAVRQQLDQVLRNVDTNIEIFYVRSLAEQHHRLYRTEFGLAVLLTILAGLMLLVTMISSYSNAHFHALKSQQDIGIKRALGASRQAIFVELLAEGWLCTLLGTGAGVFVALLLNKLLATVIVIPAIPLWLPLLSISVLMLCVTLATWYPARIATRVSPATATKTL
jgi:putative ABC transport system permease protein